MYQVTPCYVDWFSQYVVCLFSFPCIVYQEDENAYAPTTIRLIEASLRREDLADRENFR